MSNEINFCAVCPMASCKRNAQCVRYANYLKAKNEEDSYQVLNFDRISYDADKGCSHFLVWVLTRLIRRLVYMPTMVHGCRMV